MARTMVSGAATAAASDAAVSVSLLELRFAAGTSRLTTAGMNLSWGGYTWSAVGGNLVVRETTESFEMATGGVMLELSGVDTTVMALVLSAAPRGRRALVYRAWLNDGAVIADPVLVFDGFMNSSFQIQERRSREQADVSVTTRLTPRLSELSRVRLVSTNLGVHQRFAPGDTFFSTVAGLSGRRVVWGRLDRLLGFSYGGVVNPPTPRPR